VQGKLLPPSGVLDPRRLRARWALAHMFSDAIRCCHMLPDVLKSSHTLSAVLRCSQMFSYPSTCREILEMLVFNKLRTKRRRAAEETSTQTGKQASKQAKQSKQASKASKPSKQTSHVRVGRRRRPKAILQTANKNPLCLATFLGNNTCAWTPSSDFRSSLLSSFQRWSDRGTN